MATTEQRSGFRLPWTAEPRSNVEQTDADAGPIDDTTEQVPLDESGAEVTAEAVTELAPEVGIDAAVETGVDTSGVEPTDEIDAAAGTVEAEAPTETADPAAVVPEWTENENVSPDAATAATLSDAPRRPSKFMVDLTKAMQAAAESARAGTLTQFQADAKSYVEDIHARSAVQASELRKRADDDVAGIREWSKAELARVREETEHRIGGRKSELEAQLEHHAAVIEREIERVHGQVGTFEAEMARFFEGISGETDPTRIAALAENLPEPPPFEAISIELDDIVADTAGMPPVGAASDASEASAIEAAATTDAEMAEATAETGEAEAGETSDLAQADAGEPTSEATDTPLGETTDGETTDAGPQTEEEREAAMASIEAAFEAAAQAEAEAMRAEAEATAAGDGAGTDPEATADPEATTDGETASTGEADADDMLIGDTPEGEADDPRLAALGLSGFDEAEAAAAAGATDDEILTIDDDALAARLNGLVPDRATSTPTAAKAKDEATETTQVVVVGLVSVASIASFKRHLGRIQGVRSVGVSSGPDGEFVFSTTHSADVSIKDVVTSVPGFQARVTNAGDGIVNVAAHDPESEG